jgi:benzoylformate decarboxylase
MTATTPISAIDALGPVTRMSCAEATLRAMVDAGADTLFNIPGRGIYPLLNQLPKVPELEYLTCLHEFPLAAIADGYARGAGTAAWLNLYMSTGVLNAASAIFLAQRDRVPMVVTATQAESFAVGADQRAEISDNVASVRPITKWAWMPPTPDRVPEALRRAHSIATTPPCGPTFVAIPVDYWEREIDYVAAPTTELAAAEMRVDGRAMERLAELLASAEQPMLVVGYEAVVAGVAAEAQAMSHRLGCPLVAEGEPAMLPCPVDFPQFGGSVAEATELAAAADLVVHVGVSTYEAFHREIFELGVPKRHVWIGTSDLELNKVLAADLAFIGPIAPVVRALADAVEAHAPSAATVESRACRVRETIAEERAPLLAARTEGWDADPMSVARICAELRELMPPETVVVDHSTTAVRLVRENFPVPSAEQYISASGSCQGWGLPAAIGVQLARRGTPVVGFVGDGGFMFGVQAVWTAIEYRLPVLVVILNNGGWSSMRASLAARAPALLPRQGEMHFGWETDYAGLVRSFGGDAATVRTPAELREAVATRMPLQGLLVLDARCRRERKTSASPFVGY